MKITTISKEKRSQPSDLEAGLGWGWGERD